MDITKLRYFVTVAECKNITQAAKLLHISQPALSKSIKSLETELGVLLFERTGNKIVLNKNGVIMYNYGKKVISDTRKLQQKLLNIKDQSETINLVHSFPYGEPVWLFEFIKEFSQQYPSASFKILQMEREKMGHYLHSGHANIAITSKIISAPDFQWKTGKPERLGILMSNRNYLSTKKHLYIKDIEYEKILCPEKSTEMGQILREFCLREGFEANIVFEGNNGRYINDAVSKNQAVGLLSVPFYQNEYKMQNKEVPHSEVIFKEFEDDFCYRECFIGTLKNVKLSGMRKLFYESMIKMMSE